MVIGSLGKPGVPPEKIRAFAGAPSRESVLASSHGCIAGEVAVCCCTGRCSYRYTCRHTHTHTHIIYYIYTYIHALHIYIIHIVS